MRQKKIKKSSKSRPKSAGKKRPVKNQQFNAENIDPNMMQQMIMAQSQQAFRQPQRQSLKKRPSTAKPKKTGPSTLKFQPYSMNKLNMKVLLPSTPGTHFKSSITNRSQTLSKKKKKKSAKKPPRP